MALIIHENTEVNGATCNNILTTLINMKSPDIIDKAAVSVRASETSRNQQKINAITELKRTDLSTENEIYLYENR